MSRPSRSNDAPSDRGVHGSAVNGSGVNGCSRDNAEGPRILYCHCTYAKVIPPDVKRQVLAELSASGVAFEAVADLCEMSARRDPALRRLAGPGHLKIAACFPRAVQWLFHAAGTPLPDHGVEVLNMREQGADEIVPRLLDTKPAKLDSSRHDEDVPNDVPNDMPNDVPNETARGAGA